MTWCSGSGSCLSKTLPPDWHLTSGISYLWSWFQVIYLSDPSLIVLVPSPTLSERLPPVLQLVGSLTSCLLTRFYLSDPFFSVLQAVFHLFWDQLRPTVVPLITHLIRYPGPELLDLLFTVLVPGLISLIPILLPGLLTSRPCTSCSGRARSCFCGLLRQQFWSV